MQWIREHQPDLNKIAAFRTVLIITLTGNLLLAVGKGVASYYSGSIALYADAANSVADVIYSVALLIGLYMAMQPPDLTHPQGHSRFEPLVGLVVAGMMGMAGYEALRSSLTRFFAEGSGIEIGLPTATLLAAAALKGIMYFSINRIARNISSPSLRATARDNLSDVLASLAALLGILGSSFVHPLLDPIAGLLVALWIFRAAFQTGKENLGFLTGAGADEELRQNIMAVASQVDGVERVHHMMSDYVGPQLIVDLHINLPGDTTLDEVHTVTDRVIAALESMPEVDRAYVHVEPLEGEG